MEIEEEISILDYLQILVRWRKMIVGVVFVACLVAVVVSFLLPKGYTARATILPPEGRSPMSGLGALLSNSDLPIQGFRLPGFSSNSELFVQILSSRSIAERIIQQFHLMNLYQTENLDKTIEQLHRKAKFKIEKAEVVSIEVEAPTPQLAADIANAFVHELDRFNRENNMTSAKHTRVFIEQRLNEAKQDLSKAWTALQTFQERNQLFSLPEQATAAVEVAAQLEAQLRMAEVELAIKRNTLASTHPEVIQSQAQIDALRKQMTRLRFGDGKETTLSTSPTNTDFTPPFTRMPALQQELGKLMMDAKVHQAIVEFLLQQYEQAKIQEIRDTPTVRQLDVATPPDLRSSPKRALIVTLTGFVALFLAVMVAFLLEYGRNMAHRRDESQKIEQMRSSLRDDYIRLKNYFNGQKNAQASQSSSTTQESSDLDAY